MCDLIDEAIPDPHIRDELRTWIYTYTGVYQLLYLETGMKVGARLALDLPGQD